MILASSVVAIHSVRETVGDALENAAHQLFHHRVLQFRLAIKEARRLQRDRGLKLRLRDQRKREHERAED